MKKKKSIIKTINFQVRKKILALFFSCILSACFVMLFMFYFVNPIIVDTGKAEIKEKFAFCVNAAVEDIMKGTITYEDLISVVTDSKGKIVLLQANSIQINSLSRKLIDRSYKELMQNLSGTLKIPLGSFTGIPILNGLGPMVEVSATPYAAIKCKFLSQFISAGINQTVHKIYLSVDSEISMVFPFSKVVANEKSDVLVSESLIIGEIPDTYLMAAENGDMLNMVG